MKRRIKHWLLKHLFSAVIDTDFLVVKKNKIYRNGKPISSTALETYAIQARDIVKNDHIIKLILTELKYLAYKDIYYDDKSEFGKALLHAVDIISNKISVVSRLKD